MGQVLGPGGGDGHEGRRGLPEGDGMDVSATGDVGVL